MNHNQQIIGGGLIESKPDRRDFSYQKVFGALEKVPDIDFMVAEPLSIEDQGSSDYCTAYAGSSVSEDQEGIDLDPLYLFAKIKQIEGNPDGWGADLRSAAKALTKFGCIEKKDSPYTIQDVREKIVDYTNWPAELDEKAKNHIKKSYFRVDEGKDTFSTFQRVLWANRATKQSILTGCSWRADWLEAEGGIIPIEESNKWFGHAFKLVGQKIINGKIYLVAILSNGENVGNKGKFYFSREVINRDFTFGAYIFVDENPEIMKKKAWPLSLRIWEWLKKRIKMENKEK